MPDRSPTDFSRRGQAALGCWPMRFAHACIRVRDPEASRRFYRSLGFEPRRRLNFEAAYNLYMGLRGGGDTLELTVNRGRDEPSELRDGYNHMAVIVDDLDALLVSLAREGVEPEKPPYSPGGREGGRSDLLRPRPARLPDRADHRDFPTPQDPDPAAR